MSRALPFIAAALCALGLAIVRIMPCEHTAALMQVSP